MINVAVIGIGRFGRSLLKSFDEKVSVVAASSTGNFENIEKTKILSSNIRFIDNEEIACDKKIDAVVIASPIQELYNLSKLFIKSGKHVFLEKPGAINSDQLKHLRSMLKKDQILYVDYLLTLDPAYLRLKNVLNGSKIDEIKMFWDKRGSLKPDILLNLFCHELSIIHDLFDDKAIHIEKSDVNNENCEIQMKIKNIKINSLIVRTAPKYDKRVYVKTENNVYLWDKKTTSLFLNGSCIFSENNFDYNDLINTSRDKFLRMISQKERNEKNLSLSIKVLETIEKIK